MSDDKQNSTQISDKLLTAAELEVCQKIATLDTELAGRRAAILVAINEGSTHAQASEQTGLTVGQIQYLLTTFRRKRLAIFPDDVLGQAQSPAEPKEEAQAETRSAPGVDEEEKAKKSEETQQDEALLAEVDKVEKKSKKGKKAKAKKKDKKSKATKAGKKTKKANAKAKVKKKDKKSKKDKAKKADKKKSRK